MQYSELWEAVSQLSFSSPLEEGVRSKPGQEDQDDEDERPFEDDVMRFGQLACVRKRLELVCDKQGESCVLCGLRGDALAKLGALSRRQEAVQSTIREDAFDDLTLY